MATVISNCDRVRVRWVSSSTWIPKQPLHHASVARPGLNISIRRIRNATSTTQLAHAPLDNISHSMKPPERLDVLALPTSSPILNAKFAWKRWPQVNLTVLLFLWFIYFPSLSSFRIAIVKHQQTKSLKLGRCYQISENLKEIQEILWESQMDCNQRRSKSFV